MKKFLLPLLLLLTVCQPIVAKGHGLGLKKGERVIVYDSQHRRVGTLGNYGYGVLQFRDNNNRRTGHIDSAGRTYNSNRQRTGTIDWNKPGPAWR